MTETTETTETAQTIETVKFNGKTYASSSITSKGEDIIKDIQSVEGLISKYQLEVSVSQLARIKLLEELEAEAVNFTEVEDPTEPTE